MKSTNHDCGRVPTTPVVELLRYLHTSVTTRSSFEI